MTLIQVAEILEIAEPLLFVAFVVSAGLFLVTLGAAILRWEGKK